jgi:iron complex transport system substrate-binding protein
MRVLIIIIFLFNICAQGFCSPEDSSYPQRIISLGPALTEQLYLLGVEDKLVGVTTYCKRPLDAQKKEKIGTVLETNLEKIIHLEPDLVLATPLTNPKTIEKLKSLKVEVRTVLAARKFSQICEQFLELGRIVGRERRAEEIVRRAKKELGILRKKVQNLPKVRVFIQIGARPLFTAAEDSFFNDFIDFAGGINIARGAKSGLYSRERVLEDNPEVIIITAMGIGAEEKKVWRKFKSLGAVKNDRIYIVDEYKFCSPTPLSFVVALKEMIEILHFKDG